MMRVINRPFELDACKNKDRILIYGRRKTGKTFFVKNFLKTDEYYFVTKDSTIFNKKGKELSYETFFELFKEQIKSKTIAVDEFHRLPRAFLDYLHFLSTGKYVLLTSTSWLAKKYLTEKDSPLLGLVTPIKFNLIDERDILKNLNLKGKELIEAVTYLREPILIQYYEKNMKTTLTNFLFTQKYFLKTLVSEIFSEEGRSLSNIYEGILRAIANGNNKSGEISSFLFSKKIISKDNPGLIQKHLGILINLGFIEKIEVFNKKRYYYQHISPLLDLHFYLEEKYGYSEQDIPKKFLEEVLTKKMPFHIELFFRNLISKIKGMKYIKIEQPEIDIALVQFKKLKLVAEVKWRKNINVLKTEEQLKDFNVEKILITPKKINTKITNYYSENIKKLL